MKRMILRIAIGAMFIGSTAMLVQAQPAPGGGAPGAPGGAAPGAGRGAPGGFPGGRGGGGRGPVVIGPSAPVPPEVAMAPRPSAEELKTINDAFKKFIDIDTSSAKPLLKKYEAVLNVQGPPVNTAATYTQTGQRQGARHEGFVAQAKQGGIDLLLLGDSITDFWGSNANYKPMWDKYFGQYKAADFAISGDTTQGVLWGLHNGEGQGFSPKAVMMMIGTNNTGGNSAPEIAEGIGAIVLEARKDFPNAKILLLAIFPRGNPGDPVRDKIAEINKIISKLDDKQHVFYMDIGPKFLAADGTLDAVMPDRLHPNAAGYDIWGAAVKDKLAEFMK